MIIETLDLYVTLPCDCDEVIAPTQALEESPRPNLDVEDTRKVALAIGSRTPNAQHRSLQMLALHPSTEGNAPEEAKMQFRIIDGDEVWVLIKDDQ
jgi:hypothetical protein